MFDHIETKLVGFIRHGIGTPKAPNCSTKPLVLLAGAVRDRTRL